MNIKIDYKITSIVLLTILLLTYLWHWDAIFYKGMMSQNGGMSHMDGMHQMPDGSYMKNDGSHMDMMDMTMRDMVGMMEGKTGKALEKEFIAGMIPHHQGAVDMARVLLKDATVSAELKKFAEDIIRAQEGEIKMMNEWLKKY